MYQRYKEMGFGDGFYRLKMKLVDRLSDPDVGDTMFLAFQRARDNKERIAILLGSSILRPLLTLPTDFPKSNLRKAEDSHGLREHGNLLFKQRRFQEALDAYNSSILCCCRDSNAKDTVVDSLALSYANRSAVWFHLREFECCLTDIDAAETAGILRTFYISCMNDECGVC